MSPRTDPRLRTFDHALVVRLYEHGKSNTEIARLLGVGVSAVKMARYRHGLRHPEKAPSAAAITPAPAQPPRPVSDGHMWARCDRCKTAECVPRGLTLPRHWQHCTETKRDLCPLCIRAQRLSLIDDDREEVA